MDAGSADPRGGPGSPGDRPARYALLVYGGERALSGCRTPAAARAAALRLSERAQALRCTVVASEVLESGATATTLRGDAVLDGPLVDGPEELAVVHLVEAPDLDAALALARCCAVTGSAGVEVRPAVDLSG